VVLDDMALICELDEQWAYVGTKTIVIGFGIPLTPRGNESLPIPLARATMKHVVAC